MNEIRASLIASIERTPTIESFRFMPEERLNFMPGQFLQLIFDKEDRNNKELNKYLSFSSSPTKDYIEVTKRLSNSLFSQELKSLKINDQVLIKAPLGTCVLKDNYKKLVFLVGGIGITPVISMIEYVVDKNIEIDTILFYSNKHDDDIAFRKELDYWEMSLKIRIFYIVTDCQPTDRRCFFGSINEGLLKEKIDDLDERIFFIFGPPKMVDAMSEVCKKLSCRNDNIRKESFIGY